MRDPPLRRYGARIYGNPGGICAQTGVACLAGRLRRYFGMRDAFGVCVEERVDDA